MCVLENSFDQIFSFYLDGPEGKLLGELDAHNTKYDHLTGMTDTAEYERRQRNASRRSYTSLPLNTEYGQYTLRVYPMEETEKIFMTSSP